MRRAELDEVHPEGAGRSPERPVSFPDIHLYRARAGDGADCLATFDRRTIVLARPIAGIPCKIRLSLSQYQAVALIAGDAVNVIRLLHREPGLSLDLERIDSFEAAEEYRDQLASFLDLPPLTMAGLGPSLETPAEAAESVVPRRRTGRSSRPRFLIRRAPGQPIEIRRIDGREIIARH
jgi:hypothetical protein